MNKCMFASIAMSAVLALAGCASYDGRNLVPGVSTAGEVAATMGAPADKVSLQNGDTIWHYPHGPLGRHTYAVRIGSDSKVKEVSQLLTEENVARIVVKQSTRDDVKAIIGPPYRVSGLPNLRREVWEYTMMQDNQPRLLFVQFAPDGKAAEVLMLVDPSTVSMGDSGN